jgi:hypothetical protein
MGGNTMGRKSRHKLERRLGQVQSTPKEAERARVKAERRARHVPSTVEAYERVAARGPARLTETLIGRHAIRIDNLDAVAQRSMDHCLTHLLSVCELDAFFIRRGHCLMQHEPPHERTWPTHVSWALQSTVAALRLMLAGQTVGAAIVLRQQLGRWTRLLARADTVVRGRHEPIESFIARAWTQRALNTLGQNTADVAAGDIFDDLDDHPRTTGVIDTYHAHVRVADGSLCPAHVYHTLCELIDAQHADQRTEREAVHDLDADDSANDTHDPTDVLSDALALCIIQMRLAVLMMCVWLGDDDTARALRTVSAPERQLAQYTSETPLPLRESLVPRLTPALVPLVGTERMPFDNIDYLEKLYNDYHTVLAGGSLARDCTVRELAELSFAAHRFSRLMVTATSHILDRKIPDGRLKIRQHLTTASPQILTAEFAALCAHWNQSHPQIAAAATQISSTLLSGYWLWLEEDDRAMGILRCTLHQATRLHLWHNNTDAARALQNIAWTTPRRWRNAAGWQKHRSLDRALFEFAHANRQSRVDATNLLLDIHYNHAQERRSQRVARQTALDKVTAIAAAEAIKVVAAHQSPAIADTMREALHHSGLNIQTRPARRQPKRHTTPRRTEQDTTATPDTPPIDQPDT